MAIICAANAVAAPIVRNLGAAKSTSSLGRTGGVPTIRATASPNIGAARAATASRISTAPRLSIGRLHTNAGKTVSINPPSGGGSGTNMSDYALAADLDSAERRLDDADDALGLRIDDLEHELDTINAGTFPTPDGDGLYLVVVTNGIIDLLPTEITTGAYNGD